MNEQKGLPKVNKIVGMDIKEAKKHLDENGYKMRVTIRNGNALMVQYSIDMERVNVIIENGLVIDIDKIG